QGRRDEWSLAELHNEPEKNPAASRKRVGRLLQGRLESKAKPDVQCRRPLRILRLALPFFFSSRRRHTRSVSAFLLNRSSDLGIKSAIQGSNVPNPDEAVPSFVSGAMAKAGKGLLEGTLQAGTSAVSDKLLDLVGLGGKSAADKGKDTRDYLAAAFPELN